MGKIIEQTINRFDGGMTNDKRSKSTNKFSFASGFDVFSYNHKLVPRNGSEDKNTNSTNIVKFVYADRSGTVTLFGLDITAGKCVIKYFSDPGWAEPANNESSSGTRKENVFFPYKDGIFMWGSDYLKRFDTGGGAFDDSYENLAFGTTVAPPVHHPADDRAYFFVDNKVYSLNDTSWVGLVLTLPSNLKIVSACSYGNYLAIGCTTKNGITKDDTSIVFLWDRDSSLETLTARPDFGTGQLQFLGVLDNALTAVVYTEYQKEIAIKQLNGETSRVIKTISIDNSPAFGEDYQIINNKMYFYMSSPLNSDNRKGIWVVDSLGRMALDFVAVVAGSALTYALEGIYWTGAIWWFSYNSKAARSTSTASGISVLEPLIIGDGKNTFKLVKFAVLTEPLDANATTSGIKLEVKANTDSSYTTIFENKGVRYSNRSEAVNIEATGVELPFFTELETKITIDNRNIDIIGYYYKIEEVDDDL